MVERHTIEELDATPHAEVFERPRTVRLELAAGERVPEHRHPGSEIVLHLLEGRMDLALDGESHDLRAGDLIRFSGDREVSPRAVEGAVAVLVFAPAD